MGEEGYTMKKAFLAMPIAILLTACGAPSVEDLIENPEKLAEVSADCNMLMAQGKDTDTEECNNAIEATKQMMGNMMNGVMKQMGH